MLTKRFLMLILRKFEIVITISLYIPVRRLQNSHCKPPSAHQTTLPDSKYMYHTHCEQQYPRGFGHDGKRTTSPRGVSKARPPFGIIGRINGSRRVDFVLKRTAFFPQRVISSID